MASAYDRTIATARRCFEEGRFEAAAEAFGAASRMAPGDHQPLFNRALALHELGRIDAARQAYELIKSGPLRLTVLVNLARLDADAIGDADLADLTTAAATASATTEVRMKVLFAFGRVLDQRRQYDQAFAAFAEGNRLRAADLDFADLADREAKANARAKKDFTPALLRRWSGLGHPSTAPIFVVGRPRSGTTLIEQILASHPQVQGMGETHALDETISARFAWPPADDAPDDHFRRLGADYLKAMRKLGWTPGRRFVDKMPANYAFIGIIALAFPRAVILHSVRDPVDTCLSQFQQLFITGNELSYDLGELGRSYVRYRQLIEHWSAVLPGRVLDVRHETLAAYPDAGIPRLVTEACGLAWDDACLRFHENRRPVLTASASQVRRPMFTSSIGRWRNYERHLQPLIEALGPYAPPLTG